MATQLRILIVEDVPNDAELALRELKRAGIAFDARRVETAAEYRRELEEFKPQVILSDFAMPNFGGAEALAIARDQFPDIPFIFVSGAIGEEHAIRALKQGANDYVMKTNLVRLSSTVERAIAETAERRALRAAEQRLRESEERFRQIAENIREVFWLTDPSKNEILYISPAYEEIWGRSGRSLYECPRNWLDAIHPDDRDRVLEAAQTKQARGDYAEEYRIVRPDGSIRWILDKAFPVFDRNSNVYRIAGVAEDITERKQAEEALRKSETHLRAIIENEPECVKIVSASGKLLEMNQAGLAMLQAKSLTEAQQQTLLEFIVPEHRAAFGNLHKRVMNGESGTLEFEVIGLKGARRWLETRAAPLRNSAGEVPQLLGITRDITARRNQEQKIARLSRIHAVLSAINSAIVRIRNRQELFQEACRIVVAHGGFTVGWISALDHVSGKLVPIAKAGLPLDLDAGGDSSDGPLGLVPAGAAEVALREKRPAFDNDIGRGGGEVNSESGPDTLSVRRAAVRLGAKSVIVLPLYVEGKTFGILTLYAPERNFFDDEEIKLLTELAGDISFGLEFIAKEEKVDYLAYYDVLTGLPNRGLFFDRLTHQLGTAARDGLNVALVLMDLDRFRMINDTLGRQAGDMLIGAVAQRINTTFRDQDTVARVGADSFAVAVSGAWEAQDAARAIESRNHHLFGQPFLLGKEALRVSATAGVAVFPGDGDNPETLFANAEAALRKAKEQNTRFLFYSPEMNARIAESLRLENKLRRALENDELVLWYQPKVSVKTGKLTGLEALMRWKDPETGLVPPGKFIPLMEQTGLILDAGRWALSQVARDCKLWAKDGLNPPRVAVNVSPLQLRQKDFVATVVEAAEKTAEAGSMLDLEITESVIMENVATIIPKLQTICGLGVQIAVDDFGTGYSSLAYIAKLPIHDLKIDRGFVVGMTQNEDSVAIVRSVISLAHSLELQVVAEGVETEEQAALLLKLGCDQMQGYLFSPPVPPDQVPGLLSRQQAAAIRPARRRSRRSPAR